MQRKTLVTSLITAGLLALGSLGASAATVNFNFNAASTASTTESGLTVTVSDWFFAAGSGTARTLTQTAGSSVVFNALGLGMKNNPSDMTLALRGTGANPRETLNFFFSSTVKLLSVTLTQRNATTPLGDGVVFVDFVGDLDATDFATSTATTPTSQTISFSNPAYTSQNIGIGAKGGATFFISAISVDVVGDVPPPSPVPVPAAGLMLGSLALLPLLRRKRRAA